MSVRDPIASREKILEAAHLLVLRRGFAGTSLEQILALTGLTKGAFFHHFASKDALAVALAERYAVAERALVDQTLGRARALTRDPLQRLLVALGLFEEMFAPLSEPPAGCLLATFCYQSDSLAPEVQRLTADTLRLWRSELGAMLAEAAAAHPLHPDVDVAALADTLNVVLEGAFIVARTLDEAAVIPAQLRLLRTWLELSFAAPPGGALPARATPPARQKRARARRRT